MSWTFKREAKWMFGIGMLPIMLVLMSLLMAWVRRLVH